MITYNGKNLEDFGVNAVGRGTYGSPARSVEVVDIPGRNGQLVFDNGNFQNITVDYPDCSILDAFPERFAALRNFLLSSPGYHRLEDSHHPDEYRMAEFRGPLAPDVHTGRGNDSGVFTMSFNCMPQRFLKDDEPLEFDASITQKTIVNRWMPAEPLIVCRPGANKTVEIALFMNSHPLGELTIKEDTGYDGMVYTIDILEGTASRYTSDSGAHGMYTSNASSAISGDLITIPAGEVLIVCDGLEGSGYCRINPRYWRL